MGEQVWDQQGTAYPLSTLLGEGGQGQVFEVTGKPILAINRFFDKPSDEGGRAQLQRKVAALQAKRLDKSLPQAAVSGLYGRAGVVRLRDAQGKRRRPAAGALFKPRPSGYDPELAERQ